MEKFLKTADQILAAPTTLPDSVPVLGMSEVEAGIRKAADNQELFVKSPDEKKDEAVERRRALGKAALRDTYGEGDFGVIVEHMAGGAVDAFRAEDTFKGHIAVEQLLISINGMRKRGELAQGNPEEQLKDPARRAAGDAARENVAWAAGQLRVVAGTDLDEKKAKEKAKEDDKLAG
ncbi:MAG: hypothetical protein AAB927_02865 [Patescibacteria group bacterium]